MAKGRLRKIMLLVAIVCFIGIYWNNCRFVKLQDVEYSLSKDKYILSDIDKNKTYCYIKSLYQSKIKFMINESNEILIQNKEYIYSENIELLWNYSSKAKEMANKADQYGIYCNF